MQRNVRAAVTAVTISLALVLAGGVPARSAASTTIESGHVDVIAGACPTEGVLDLFVRAGSVPLDPASTLLVALPASQVVVPEGIAPAYYAILGPAGSTVWILPQSPEPGILFPGWDFEDLVECFHHHDEASAADGDHDHDHDHGGDVHVELRLIGASGPGRVVVYFSGFEPTVLFDTASALPQTYETGASHGHANWAFHAPGSYALTFAVHAHHHPDEVLAADEDELSATITVFFEVRGDPPAAGAGAVLAQPRFTG